MGKITKPMQPKHKDTLSPWLKSYVETTSTTPLPLLPQKLESFPSRWPFGRGDLYHWIPLLNRFDSILEHFCATYKLNEGPQTRDFGCDVLLNQDQESTFGSERRWSTEELTGLGFSSNGDQQLVEVVLRYTRMLLEHCGNRSIYASSAHLNDLLNTTSLSVLIATLEVGSELAQRYQASVKRITNPSRQISAALLANHYNIDLDRVQQLALPFVKTPIVSLSDPVITHTPGSTKGKERAQGGSSKSANSIHANDLVALAASDDKRWHGWGDVKVTYYPQNTQQDSAGNDAERASLPSTPTPLRRSSTMTSQHHTPKGRGNFDDSSPIAPRTPGVSDETTSAGPKFYEIPQSVIASTSVYELVSRTPADLPLASKYEAFHRIRASKALMDSCESRQKLLAVRLLAINNLAYIHNEANFLEKVLRQDADETRRFQLVYQLAELIHPTAHGNVDVPLWLQAVALALLEAVSNFQAKCQDVLSALNANVNHGILLYVIRKAVAGMKEDDESDKGSQVTQMDEWRNNLFSLTLHLSMTTRVGSEMVSAGLMDILVEILNIRSSVAQRNHSMVLAFLDGLIWSYQNAFTAFFNAKGLDAVSQLVVDTVGEAQTLHKAGQGISKDQQSGQVDYEIPYYQQQTLKWLLKFVHHIMSNSYSYGGNTDRLLRNLADKTDLLKSLRDIIGDKKSFGSVVWTNSVTILSDFINNDPTSFAAISESGMIKTYLEAVTARPLPGDVLTEPKPSDKDEDDEESNSANETVTALVANDSRPHPPPEESIRELSRETLAAGILPSSDVITVVPQVLNSISLNNAGMKLVAASRALDSFLEIFESAAHVRCMELDGDLATNVGGSFDELARHHPALRLAISNAVIDMVARVRYLGIEKARTAGWGARMLLIDDEGKTVSVDENGSFIRPIASPEQSQGLETSGDTDVNMSDVPSNDTDSEGQKDDSPDSPTRSITPYIYALGYFLSSYISNQGLRTSFVEAGGLELLLDICESPSLPTNFGDTVASRILNQVVSQVVESFPIRGLPSLIRRAQVAIDTLQPLSDKTEALPPYFAPFLVSDLKTTHDEAVQNGTKMIKALSNAQTFIKIISDCFATSRSNALQFYPVNVYDYYLKLVNSIGPLLRGVLTEEAGELNVVPQHWSFRRQTSAEGLTSAHLPETDVDDSTSLPDMLSSTAQFQAKDASDDSKPSRPTDEEQASPRFQNYETLRHLLHPMIPTTFPLFQTLGKCLLPRRERDPRDLYHRPRHLEIARALANAVLGQLRPSVANPTPTSKDFHFWIIMLHTINEMLIDQPSPRPSDRSSVQIIMPVLLAFKEEGGMDVLNSMLKIFARAVREGPDAATDETSRSKVAAFGLKKVLDLDLMLVNSKQLSEAQNAFSLQPRSGDRSSNSTYICQQLVIEFRAAILPEIIELWDSSFVERVPHQTVTRLIDILKAISVADGEPSSSTRDKPPFHLFRYTDVRFDWRSHRGTIEELVAKGYDTDLVHEAVYRANGNPNLADHYCSAHKAGLAGARNPIPSADSDTSVLQQTPQEPSAVGETEGANTGGAVEADRMSLDGPPEIDTPDLAERFIGETLGGIINSPQDVDEIREGPSLPAETPGSAAEESKRNENPPLATKEEVDKFRANLRGNMIDRCLDVVRAHPETAIEVSELIRTVVLKQQPGDNEDEIGQTLTLALSSLAQDEEEEKQRTGKCIAAYAHLLALLLQDERFFDNSVENLREHINEYIGFLKISPTSSTEGMPPWIPYVLLVVETLLRHDERPVAAQWKAPKSLDEAVSDPVIQMRTPIVGDHERTQILESLLEMLPRIGKEETLAIAALRVLVILTRSRRLAKLVGDKKNLQRLFLMAKQLSGSGSERFKQTKLTAHIMTVLRHIVEDEETIKQIMRAEIKIGLLNLQRTQRGHTDVTNYLRAMTPIALRAPDLFVEISNEMLRFPRWTPPSSDNPRSQILELKQEAIQSTSDTSGDDTDNIVDSIKQSTEPADKEMTDAPKTHESKRPVVENPDGVIHFLLCELLNYREVEDKEVQINEKDPKVDPVSGSEDATSTSKDNNAADVKDKKPPKPVFKTDEHPIFVYRCFLLNCLAELLQSYNRTKMEFINFKRNAPLTTSTPIKPRSSVLNYLIYDLLCQGNLSGTADSIAAKKKAATSAQTQKVLVALVAKTSEKAIDRGKDKFAYDDEPDLLFARKFVLDTMLKAYERAPLSDEPLETRYSRMQCLAELMNYMVGERDKDPGAASRGSDNVQARSHAQLRRLMYEKGYLDKLTSSIAEINLNYPGVKRAIKYILRVLRVLTETAKELSHSNILPSGSLSDTADDDLDDDGNSEWESASHDDEDDEDQEEDDLEFDADVHGEHMPMEPGDILNGMARAIIDNPGRRRFIPSRTTDSRSPFPPGFIVGSHRDAAAGDFRSFFSRSHRPGAGQSNPDDGTNPLLRRGDQNREASQRPTINHTIGLRVPEAIFGSGGRHIEGTMGFLGELMEFLPIMGRNGQPAFHLQITGPHGHRESRELGALRTSRTEQRREGSAQDPLQAVSFAIEGTMDRYQEEARMVFGTGNLAETAKLQNIIVAKLTPAAMELEKKLKAEEAEQQKREEEERKKREEEERLAREAKEAKEKAEREKREAEAREAAERAASEAAANQDVSTEGQGDGGAMEGVEPTNQSQAERSEATEQTADDGPRVMTTIRGEEVDVTELGIDPDYIAALPEEFREEVIAQAISTRRSEAREETNGNSTEAFQEFLDALPEELRHEIAQQERQEQRRRAREETNRQASASTGQAVIPEMDTASILLTFPPDLRQQVLMDQGEELMDRLTPEMAAQARALSHHNNGHSVITGRSPQASTNRQPGPPDPQEGAKVQRRTVVQMLDKAGVATLLRLMFITQQGSIRNHLFNVFADVCENKQTRLEVISTLLQILQDGSTDMGAVERSFGQLSLKARRPKDKEKDSEQKTPQALKRSLTGLPTANTTQTNSETSPLLIVQQCLDLLVELSSKNPHIPWLFLTEHEAVGSTLKRSLSRKGKGKDSKSHKYAINSLLSLLDRDLVMESSVVMTHLADLLNRVTLPLQNLERRRKEAEDELKAIDSTPVGEMPKTEDPVEQASKAEPTETSNVTQSSTDAKEDTVTDVNNKKQEKKEAVQKKLRQLQPPIVPAQNLTLAVRIFVARECSSKTFQNTISTIKNLSAIPGAKATFGQELVHQARLLSENIVADLDDLLPHIEKASSGTEIQGVALAKFSPGASEQNKLLRVLTALDHLFDNKKKGDEAESSKDKDERHDLVTSLYHNSTFSAMWEKLSACLSAIRQRESMLNVATILLPLIESLMVVCKNTTTNDDPSQQKEMVLSSPAPESRTASLFFSFTEDHRRILNELVRSNPKLMSGTFALLVKNPKVLEFDNKRNYFNRSVHSRSGSNQSRPSYPTLQLSVRREQVFHDSFKSLYFKSGDEMKFGKLNIRFHGEEGVDAGGVTREWFQVLSRQMFDPNYVLFTPVSSDRTTFHPNKLSGINDEHLMFFKFIGRIIGKALYEGRVLDCYFSRAVYKRILGKSVSVKDMESFDPDYYKSLCWMLENDITDIITETFSVENDEFGATTVVDLIPNGREIAVTEENKHDYVRLVVEHKLLSSVKEQMAHFLQEYESYDHLRSQIMKAITAGSEYFGFA
ncbi:E3 ubiquitin-protein ligase HUWE1 [Fusarium proliferatum]|uniref:HECT-type E3 ubiquitin transferase n=1 Tax=Gibberella intermedia TaxID=948311 RepID=A0A365MUJ6_GIBIN|nr:E3 ubiquitin-protein ligase HUWE1 [Fusarium proliferatum]